MSDRERAMMLDETAHTLQASARELHYCPWDQGTAIAAKNFLGELEQLTRSYCPYARAYANHALKIMLDNL